MTEAITPGENADESYLLSYESLFHDQAGLRFPFDANGCVELDGLGARELNDYLFARALVGLAFSAPRVTRAKVMTIASL